MPTSFQTASSSFDAFIRDGPVHCIEHSTKIAGGRAHRDRVNVWFKEDRTMQVERALTLFAGIAAHAGTDFDVAWVREVAARVDPEAAKAVVVGTDFRPDFVRSRLKLAFSFVDDPAAVATALGLGPVAPWIADAVQPHRLMFGVAIDGAGGRHVKLYPSFHLDGDDCTRFERYAALHLHPPVRALAAQCRRVFFTEGAPAEGAPLVVHFRPRDLDAFLAADAFSSESVTDEVRRQRDVGRRPLVVSALAQELREQRVRTCNLYAFESASRSG